MPWPELHLLLALLRREFQLGRRSPFFWAMAGVGGAYTLWRVLSNDNSFALVGYQITQFSVIGLGVAGVLLGGMTAGRDVREQARELVLSKMMGNQPLLVVARFFGAWLSLLAVVGVMLLVAAVGMALTGGRPWDIATYGNTLWRSALPLALAIAVGFTLTTLFATPFAAAIAAIYWVAVPLAQAHLPAVFDVTVAQHWLMVLCFTLALITLSGWRYGTAIIGVRRRGLGLIAFGLLALGVLAAYESTLRGEDAISRTHPLLAAMNTQSAQLGVRAPGFWLPEATRQLVGLDDFAGRPVLLLFWSPEEPASITALKVIQSLAIRYRAQHLACLAVCIDHDQATLAPFAREFTGGVTLLQDQGYHFVTGKSSLDSVLANVYAIEQVPTVFYLDRERRLKQKYHDVDPSQLPAIVAHYLEP